MGKIKKEKSSRAVIKALFLTGLIVGATLLFRYTSVRTCLTPAMLGKFFESIGPWGPLIYVAIFIVGGCLFIPGSLLVGLGAAIFGPYQGFVYVWIGAMLGAGASFFLARTLGRELAASLIGDRFKKYDDAIEKNGFSTVFYLRLINFPYTPMNFGMGLTQVRFSDYMTATALGMTAGLFIFTFFIGTIRDIWVSGNWAKLLSLKVFFSIGLFMLLFFIPLIIKRIKAEKPGQT